MAQSQFELAGQVVSESGQVLAGIIVAAHVANSAELTAELPPSPIAVTESDGEGLFVLSGTSSRQLHLSFGDPSGRHSTSRLRLNLQDTFGDVAFSGAWAIRGLVVCMSEGSADDTMPTTEIRISARHSGPSWWLAMVPTGEIMFSVVIGALVFGALSGVAGYLWRVSDIPLFIVLPVIVGLYELLSRHFGRGKALRAGLAGGVVWILASCVLLVLAQFRPYPPDHLSLAAASVLAALPAGAIAGHIVDRIRGAHILGVSCVVAMLAVLVGNGVLQAGMSHELWRSPEGRTLAFAIVGAVGGAWVGLGSAVLTGAVSSDEAAASAV